MRSKVREQVIRAANKVTIQPKLCALNPAVESSVDGDYQTIGNMSRALMLYKNRVKEQENVFIDWSERLINLLEVEVKALLFLLLRVTVCNRNFSRLIKIQEKLFVIKARRYKMF